MKRSRPTRRDVIVGSAVALTPALAQAGLKPPGGGAPTVAVAPPQTPTGVNYTPSGPLTVLDNTSTATSISTVNVATSDGLAFTGTTTLVADAGGRVTLSGNNIVPAHNFTSLDDGSGLTVTVQAAEHSVSVSGNLTLNVIPPGLVVTNNGTPFIVNNNPNSSGFNASAMVIGTGTGAVISGTKTLGLGGPWLYGGQPGQGMMQFQYYLDGKPVSPPLWDMQLPPPADGNNSPSPKFSFSWDTTKFLDGTSVPDGSHVLHGVFSDFWGGPPPICRVMTQSLLIYNATGGVAPVDPPAQTVYTSANQIGMVRSFPASWPDAVTYQGPSNRNPANAAQPWTHINSPPLASGNTVFSANLVHESIAPRIFEYATEPVWCTSPAGGVYVLQRNVEAGDPGTTSLGPYLAQLGLNFTGGGHCQGDFSWASTWVEHPLGFATGGFYGIELFGRLIRLNADFSVDVIAGYTKDPTKLSYNYQDRGGIGEDGLKSRMMLIGSEPDGINLGTGMDLAFDPLDATHDTLIVVKQEDCCIAKVTISTGAVHLFAGADGTPGYNAGAVTLAASLFDNPTSLCIAPNGDIYIADTNNCVIRKIDHTRTGNCVTTFLGTQATRPSPSSVASSPVTTFSPTTSVAFGSVTLPYPWVVRFNSTGDIILYENMTQHVRRINFGSSTVTSIGWWGSSTPNTPLFGPVGQYTWAWIDVDTAGVFGRVDDIMGAQVLSGDGAAETYWACSITGTQCGQLGAGQPISQVFGTNLAFYQGWSHYPWAIAISKFEARLIAAGVSGNSGNMVRAAVANDWLQTFSNLDAAGTINTRTLFGGQAVYATGTVAGRGQNSNGWPNSYTGATNVQQWPLNIRPSFYAIRGAAGIGRLGVLTLSGGVDANSFDALNTAFPYTTPGDAGDQALANYIRSGFGGSVPRPEITGNDMRDLIYYVRTTTQKGSVGVGTPRVPYQPYADDPDTGHYPKIIGMSVTRVDGTTVTVNWTTDKPTIGLACCGSHAQVRQSSGGSNGYPYIYPVNSPIENMTVPYGSDGSTGGGLTHSVTMRWCPVGALHVSVVVKDMAGNSAYAGDQVVDPYVSPDGTQIDTLNSPLGVVYNQYGAWTFGPVATPGTGAGPPGPFGNYRYIRLNGKFVMAIGDIQGTVGCASAIRVDFSGRVFFLTSQNDRIWFEWIGYQGLSQGGPPCGLGADPPPQACGGVAPSYIVPSGITPWPLPVYTGLPAVASTDGTNISGGTGSLVTFDGKFTFGSGSTSWPVTLNGVLIQGQPGGGLATQMQVACNGNLFAKSAATNHWYLWAGCQWNDAGTTVPAGPIPIEVTLTTNLVTSPTLTTAAPSGTGIATISVAMSDGSPFLNGSFGFKSGYSITVTPIGSNPNNLINSGMTLVTSGPTVTGASSWFVTATAGGVSLSVGASGIETLITS